MSFLLEHFLLLQKTSGIIRGKPPEKFKDNELQDLVDEDDT